MRKLLLLLTGLTCIFYMPQIDASLRKAPPIPPRQQSPTKAPIEKEKKEAIKEPAKAPGEQYIITITNKQKEKLASYFKKVEDAKNAKNESAKKLAEIEIMGLIDNIDGTGKKLYPDYMGLENCPLSVKAITLDLPSLLQKLIKNGANVNMYMPYKNLKGSLLYFACARSARCLEVLIKSKKIEDLYAEAQFALSMLGSPESTLKQAEKETVIRKLIAQDPSIKTLVYAEPSLKKIVATMPDLAIKAPPVSQKNKPIPAAPTRKAPPIPHKPIPAKALQYAQTLTNAQKDKLFDYFREIITLEKEQEIREIEKNIIEFINNIDGKGTKLDPNYKLGANSLINLATAYKLPALLHELKIKIGKSMVTTSPIEVSAKPKTK